MKFLILLDSSRQEKPKIYKILIKQWKKYTKDEKTQKQKKLKNLPQTGLKPF